MPFHAQAVYRNGSAIVVYPEFSLQYYYIMCMPFLSTGTEVSKTECVLQAVVGLPTITHNGGVDAFFSLLIRKKGLDKFGNGA